MVVVLKCPICGRDVLSRQLKLLVSASLKSASQAETVVCHCPDSHRFVASLKQFEREAAFDKCGGEEGAEKEGAAVHLINRIVSGSARPDSSSIAIGDSNRRGGRCPKQS